MFTSLYGVGIPDNSLHELVLSFQYVGSWYQKSQNSQPSRSWVGRSNLRPSSLSSFNHLFTHFKFLTVLSPHTLMPLIRLVSHLCSSNGVFFSHQSYAKSVLARGCLYFDTLQLLIYCLTSQSYKHRPYPLISLTLTVKWLLMAPK